MVNENYAKIDSLNASAEAKEILRKTERVASSQNDLIKKSVKDLFVICPDGAGLSEYAKVYENIITSNGVYPQKGKGTYSRQKSSISK